MSVVIIVFLKVAKTRKLDNDTTASMPLLYPVGFPLTYPIPQPSNRNTKCRDARCISLTNNYSFLLHT